MAYARYIKKKGKIYGPYYYRSVRERKDKVTSIYVGKESNPQSMRFTLQKFRPGKRTGLVLSIIIIILALSVTHFLGTKTTGFLVYAPNQSISETLVMEVNRFVPKDAVVFVSMENQTFSSEISSLVSLPLEKIENEKVTIEGFYIENLSIGISSFYAPETEGIHTITAFIAYNETEIANASIEISVQKPPAEEGQGETVANESQNFTESQNATYLENRTEITEEVVQYSAEINKPVKWVKKIRLPEKQKGLVVKIPEKSLSVEVRKVERELVQNVTSLKFRQNEIEIEEEVQEIEVEYFTETPQVEERQLSPHRKTVTVYSEMNYTNVLTYTDIGDYPKESIALYWIRDDTKELFTNVTYIDANGNGLIDRIEWVTPHLSNQTFEVDITVLNVQSYPQIGGNWTVFFTTAGQANLTITTINGTLWSDSAENYDLRLLEVKCGNQTLPYTWIDGSGTGSVFIENYSCQENGSETSKVLTGGHHYLEFRFGTDVAYAQNKAGDPHWYQNSTNGTGAGTYISHNTNWTSDAGLSGYTFSFYNGSNWTDGNCADYVTQSECQSYGCTWGPQAYVPTYYINTTDSTWNNKYGTSQKTVNSLTWTAESDSRYLVMAYGDMRYNATGSQGIIQIYQGATEQFYVADRPAVISTEFMPFAAMQVYEGTGASITYDIRESASAAAGLVSTRNTRLIALRLDNMPNANYSYMYNTAETTNVNNVWDDGGVGSDYEQVTINPSSAGYYFIWAGASMDSGSTTSQASWRVNIDSGTQYIPYLQGPSPSWSYAALQDRNAAERVNFNVAAIRYLTAASHTVRMSFVDVDGTPSADWRDRSIIVFRLSDVFNSWFNTTTVTEASLASQTASNRSVINIPSGNDGNYIIIGSQAMRGSATTVDFEQGLNITNANYGIRAWRPYNLTDYTADAFITNYTGTSPVWTGMWYRRQDASGTVYVKNSDIVAINMSYSISTCSGTPNYEFKNDSWIPFTGTQNWSNVTKFVNITSGTTIKWKVYANDSSGNWNSTTIFSYFTTDSFPDPYFVSPTLPNESISSNNWIYVNVSGYDPFDTCLLEWNDANESMTVLGSYCYLNKTGLSEGSYYFRVYANNSAGYMNVTENRKITLDLTAPLITVSSIGGDSTVPYSISDNTPLAEITTSENADCRASLSDEDYDQMADDVDCTGDGGTSHSCQFSSSIPDSASQGIYFSCNDSSGNKNIPSNNRDSSAEIDTQPPSQSGWNPAKGSSIPTASPVIIIQTGEDGDCKWSLTDQSYSSMAGDCTGDGGTSHSCSASGLLEGPEIVYIACRDDTDVSPNENSNASRDWLFVNVSGNENLHTCILNWNGANESIVPEGEYCYINKTGLPEDHYYFKVYANDTAGNLNVTDDRMSSVDYPPRYSLNSTNTTEAGRDVQHRLYWQDPLLVGGFIFSFHNGSNWTDGSCSAYPQIQCPDFGCSWDEASAGNSTSTVSVLTGITDEGTANLPQYSDRTFYDPNNNRWHTVIVDASSDIHTWSTSDLSTWIDGIDIIAGTFDWDDYDCVRDVNGANAYIHCVYVASGGTVYVRYKRCELTGTAPYITCLAEEVPLNVTAQTAGGTSLDRVWYPRVAIDSNRCVLISVDMEDDSEATADEHEVILTKEASSTTCGDGDWDYAEDTETGFPIESIQSEVGYNAAFSAGIRSFGDLDAQIVWENTDSTTVTIWKTIYFNGTSNSVGTERQLDADIEYQASKYLVIAGEKSVFFAMDDITTDLDAFIITSKDGALSSQVDTGLNVRYVAGVEQEIASVVDTRAPGGDDIWVFGVDSSDTDGIYYANSTDGGSTWSTPVLWINDAGTDEIKYMSASFDNETCNITVAWQNSSVSPWAVMSKTITTGSCRACVGTPNYEFKNDSWVSFSGTQNWSNVTKNINNTLGATIKWKVYSNDSAGNWNSTPVFSYQTTDETPPYFRFDQDNSSGKVNVGETVKASVFWNDSLSNLNRAILRTNETGSWANRSYYSFTSKPEYSNFSIDTTSHGGETICWLVWANDSSGNLNSSISEHCFDVNRPPILSAVIISPSTPLTIDTLDCGALGSDPDAGDVLHTDFTWYRDTGSGYSAWTDDDENGILTSNNVFVNTSSTGDIEPADTVKGYKFKCQATLYDGNGASVVMNSSEVTIQNSAPNPDSGWSPSSTHNTGQDFTWTEGSDDDGDAVTSFLCIDDDSAGRNSEACDTYSGSGKDSPVTDVTLVYGGTTKTYYGRLRATDGQASSSNYDFTFTITNTQPSAPSGSSLAGLTTGDSTPTITFIKGTDSDSNPSDTVTQYVSVDSSGYTDSGNTYATSGDISQFTITPDLADGTYYVRQWANDGTGASNSRSANYEYAFTVQAELTIESIQIQPDEGNPGVIINPVENSNKAVNVTVTVANSTTIHACEVRIFNSSTSYPSPIFLYQGTIQNCGATCECFREWNMEYWRNDGEWNVSVYINVTNGVSNFTSQNFTYNTLTSIDVNTSSIIFSGIPEQTVNSTNSYPLQINNTGNQVVNINIKGSDFTGLSQPGYVVGVGNSTYNETSNGAYQQLTKNFVQVFGNLAPAGSKSLFFRAYLPAGFIQQDYQNTIEIST
ncbi:MAG: hypothetical protein NTY20_02535 [Candidatus Aenigmarchaeota archaeon]|nr:hypothetical protein [Candidatus Aenigmarchaeota archaeon]